MIKFKSNEYFYYINFGAPAVYYCFLHLTDDMIIGMFSDNGELKVQEWYISSWEKESVRRTNFIHISEQEFIKLFPSYYQELRSVIRKVFTGWLRLK